MHVQRPETSLKTKGDIMLGQNMYCRRTVGFGANGMAWGPGHSGGGGTTTRYQEQQSSPLRQSLQRSWCCKANTHEREE